MSNGEESTGDPKCLITEEAVTKTLQADKGEEAELTSFEVVDFTKPGDNYSNFVTSIEVKYSLDGEDQEVVYIAKVNPCRNIKGFDLITNYMFKGEVDFYLTVAPELNAVLEEAGKDPLNIPKCYYGETEMGAEHAYYEDLRARGFKMVERADGLDAAHTTLVLKELAKLHAASCLLQEKNPDETLEAKFDPTLKDWMNLGETETEVMVQMMKGHIGQAEKILKQVGGDERALKWLAGLKPEFKEIFGTHLENEAFASVCHGIPWSNNFVFSYDDDGEPQEVMLLDFEDCRYSSLACDLNILLYSSLTGEVRKDHMEEFLDTYFSTYKDVIEAAGSEMKFNEEELQCEFKRSNVLGALFAVMIIPNILLESGDMLEVGNTIDGDIDGILEDYWANMQEKIKSSKTIKPRFLSMFEEFMETGLIP